LEELVRRGARAILQRAIRAELELLLDDLAEVSLIDGRRAVMRNGHLPAREILTTVGPVEVRVPKVRERTGSGVKFNSVLAPPYVRRSARVAAALPWLYLKGISSGDLGEALEVLVGDGAKGLSPAALGRLKAQWSEEYQGWTRRSLAGREYAYCWADGIYTPLRGSEDPKLCLLVIIGVSRRYQGVGGHRRRPARIHRILARRPARSQGAGPKDRSPPGCGRRRTGLLVGARSERVAGLSRDGPSALLVPQDGQCALGSAEILAGQGEERLAGKSFWRPPTRRPNRRSNAS
jgi:hypothetical protein